jgi:hypothetical protein
LQNIADAIGSIILPVLRSHRIGDRRGSEAAIVPRLTTALNASGFAAGKYRIPGPLCLGRSPETGELRQPQTFAEADIGIYREGDLVGVLESEHDLAWVVPHGGKTPSSSGAPRYTMSSLALSSSGVPFSSYAPLERMAYIARWRGTASATAVILQNTVSDEPSVHNPRMLALFLVSEKADQKCRILEPRMKSLGVRFYTSG